MTAPTPEGPVDEARDTPTVTMEVIINGEVRSVSENLTLVDLITHLGIDSRRVAVERNRSLARRSDWGQIELRAGDRIEIVEIVGGG